MCMLDTEVVITDEEALVTAGAELMGGMGAVPAVVGPWPWAPWGPCGPWGPTDKGCPPGPAGPFRAEEWGDRTVSESGLGEARGELEATGGR